MAPDSQQILDRLAGLHPKLIDLSLGRIERLLRNLGNPHFSLPPVVHVAGTNGKGSLIAFLRAFLEAAGYRAHVYTSPHLVTFNERIRIAGKIISDQALGDVLQRCEDANAGEAITFFEITTAAAFVAFNDTPADIVLLETGLGGRLDATNVIDAPALTVITPVSIDHQEFLGDTLDDILGEKAGIMKPGVPCIFASQARKAPRLLSKKAKELNAPLIREGQDWHVRKSGDQFTYHSGDHAARLFPVPRLAGAHQIRNAGLAIACADRLDGFDIPDAAISLGLRSVQWPGRLQRIDSGPLVAAMPGAWELWLDGGHNAAAAKTIAAQFRIWRDKPLYLILGMINSKDPIKFLQPLEGKITRMVTVTIPGQTNAFSADELLAAAHELRLEGETAPDLAAGVSAIIRDAPAPGRILIAGSLYLAGEVLKDIGPEE